MSEEKSSVDVCESVKDENESIELSVVDKTNDVACEENESEESGEEMDIQCDCCVIEANAESTTEALTGKEKENENKTPLIKSLVLPWFFSFEPLRRESELRCNGFTRQLTAVSVPLTRSCTLSIRSFGRYTVHRAARKTVVRYNGKEYPFTPRSSKALFNYDAISVGLILPSHLQAVTRCGVPINPDGAKVVTRHSQNGESEKRPTYVICNTDFFPYRRVCSGARGSEPGGDAQRAEVTSMSGVFHAVSGGGEGGELRLDSIPAVLLLPVPEGVDRVL